MPTVRPATAADLPALARALASLPLMLRYGQTVERLESSLAGAMARGEGVLVYDDGGPRGLAWYLPTGTLGVGGYLRLLAVSPDAHGGGIGAKLLDGYEAAVFKSSAHAFLLVSDFNEAAQRFYERHGYQRVGALPGLVLADVSELIYWKPRPRVGPVGW
jgi:ribosomal protein S18 acetylase RimI-like enzyme